jgi:hypothetical protein
MQVVALLYRNRGEGEGLACCLTNDRSGNTEKECGTFSRSKTEPHIVAAVAVILPNGITHTILTETGNARHESVNKKSGVIAVVLRPPRVIA